MTTIISVFILGALVMYQSAIYFVDIATQYPPHANVITYIINEQKQLLKPTKVIFLLFLWSLLSAYLSALAQASVFLFSNTFHGQLFYTVSIIAFLNLSAMLRGSINKYLVLLMFMALASIFLSFDVSSSSHELFTRDANQWPWSAFGIVMMSFGFHHIIPSLQHIEGQSHNLKFAIRLSVIFIILVYLAWVLLILSISNAQGITLTEPLDFLKAQNRSDTTSISITNIVYFFSYLASLTSTLGVSIGLMDFLKDSVKNTLTDVKFTGFTISIITIAPALIINIAAKDSFMLILQWASYFGLYILVLLPCWLHYKAFNKLTSLLTALIGLVLIMPSML